MRKRLAGVIAILQCQVPSSWFVESSDELSFRLSYYRRGRYVCKKRPYSFYLYSRAAGKSLSLNAGPKCSRRSGLYQHLEQLFKVTEFADNTYNLNAFPRCENEHVGTSTKKPAFDHSLLPCISNCFYV